jgi:hypothetical protein
MEHVERKHALLSASGSARWINCPPSARLEEKFQESAVEKTSIYAEEGTLAHEFAEIELLGIFNRISDEAYKKEIRRQKRKVKKFFNGDSDFLKEMETEVKKYTSYISDASHKYDNPLILIEEKADFSHLVQGGFGTLDCGIVSEKTLEVIDLKYGKGIKVDADFNTQLMLYALGIINMYSILYDIDYVILTIIQPRLSHQSSWSITKKDLLNWGEITVKPAASLAITGEGDLCVGDHCKWCKVKAMCSAMANKNLELAIDDFKDPYLLSDGRILEVYKQLPMLIDWAASISEHMTNEALKGKFWNGYKLVEGRSIRKWTDEKKVIDVLSKNHDISKFMITKLKGIPDVEKKLGAPNFEKELSDLVLKPPGKPTLVPETDKRPAINAGEEFRETIEQLNSEK